MENDDVTTNKSNRPGRISKEIKQEVTTIRTENENLTSEEIYDKLLLKFPKISSYKKEKFIKNNIEKVD